MTTLGNANPLRQQSQEPLVDLPQRQWHVKGCPPILHCIPVFIFHPWQSPSVCSKSYNSATSVALPRSWSERGSRGVASTHCPVPSLHCSGLELTYIYLYFSLRNNNYAEKCTARKFSVFNMFSLIKYKNIMTATRSREETMPTPSQTAVGPSSSWPPPSPVVMSKFTFVTVISVLFIVLPLLHVSFNNIVQLCQWLNFSWKEWLCNVFFCVFYSILCWWELFIITVLSNNIAIASHCSSFIFSAGMLLNFCVFSNADGHLDPSWCCADILMHMVGKSLVRADSEE